MPLRGSNEIIELKISGGSEKRSKILQVGSAIISILAFVFQLEGVGDDHATEMINELYIWW